MKTLVLFYPGCIEFEVMLAAEILNAKYPVEVATPDGADHQGSNGMVFKAKMAFADVKPLDYKVILIPGGNPGWVVDLKEMKTLLRACHESGAVMAAICAGPALLDAAGILKGKQIAHGFEAKQLEYLRQQGFFKACTLTDEALIVDTPIITARADSFIDFAVETARAVGALPDERVEFFKNYYRAKL